MLRDGVEIAPAAHAKADLLDLAVFSRDSRKPQHDVRPFLFDKACRIEYDMDMRACERRCSRMFDVLRCPIRAGLSLY